VVTWTVAEGSRGRRWREVRTAGEGIVSSLLLETAPDRRFAHLELSTAAGLLTLHPEVDGTLHGNTVSAAGVAHVVAVPWPEGSVLLIEGSAIGDAAGAWQAAAAHGDAAQLTTTIGLDLTLRASTTASGQLVALDLDPDGLPVPPESRSWPLEIEVN